MFNGIAKQSGRLVCRRRPVGPERVVLRDEKRLRMRHHAQYEPCSVHDARDSVY